MPRRCRGFPGGALFAVHDDKAVAAFDLRDVARALDLAQDCVRLTMRAVLRWPVADGVRVACVLRAVRACGQGLSLGRQERRRPLRRPSARRSREAAARKVKVIPVRAEPGAMARLRAGTRTKASYLAWADNTIAGPVEVMLRFTRARTCAANPPCPRAPPCRPAQQRAGVAADAPREAGTRRRFRAEHGRRARRSARAAAGRRLPAAAADSARLRIDQGFGGSFSHTDAQNRYAIDFAADRARRCGRARAAW